MNSLKSKCCTGIHSFNHITLVYHWYLCEDLPNSEGYVDFHDHILTLPIYYCSYENIINIYCLFSGTVPECRAGFQHTFSLPTW
jgi:hypothetical protein